MPLRDSSPVNLMRRALFAFLAVMAAAATGWLIWRNYYRQPDNRPPPLVKLAPEQMRQLPDPHQPMPPAGSALWCASTHAAWKQLPALLKVPAPVLVAQPELSGWMNRAPDPAAFTPAKSLFSLAGPANAGTIARIHEGVIRQFGEPVVLPLVPGGLEDFIAFARLQVEAKFPVPYANRQGGLRFTDGAGKTTTVRAFGNVPDEGEELLPGVHLQPQVLFADSVTGESAKNPEKDEFAINLSGDAADVEVIVACLPKPASLQSAWEHVKKRTAQFPEERGARSLVGGTLAVPLLGFDAVSSLPDLQGALESPASGRITTAAQMVQFSLDRTGARLKSETWAKFRGGKPPRIRDYLFDRPFLLAMRQRDAGEPFFLLWVDDTAMMSDPGGR